MPNARSRHPGRSRITPTFVAIPPHPVNAVGAPYPTQLVDAWAIADYIETIASDDVAPDMIRETFFGGHAVLQLVPLESLAEGPRGGNRRSVAKERRYRALPVETLPPLLTEAGVVRDGNHRFRMQRQRGQTHVWAYGVRYAADPAPPVAQAG